MARVFTAIDIEDDKILKELENVRDTIDLGFSQVPGEKMHVTLQFFEDIDREQIKKVEKTLDNIEVDPFGAEIRSVGAFPSEDYIRVVWAGMKFHEVFDLQKQAKVHDVPSENHDEFKPHITFLRVDDVSGKRKEKLQRSIQEFKEYSFGTVEVESVKIFESELKPSGSEYTVLSEHEL
ncbi:MAG: RNA 2',3'-cyclic phosphodiesterase [Candidatus Nanosalina sp.]